MKLFDTLVKHYLQLSNYSQEQLLIYVKNQFLNPKSIVQFSPKDPKAMPSALTARLQSYLTAQKSTLPANKQTLLQLESLVVQKPATISNPTGYSSEIVFLRRIKNAEHVSAQEAPARFIYTRSMQFDATTSVYMGIDKTEEHKAVRKIQADFLYKAVPAQGDPDALIQNCDAILIAGVVLITRQGYMHRIRLRDAHAMAQRVSGPDNEWLLLPQTSRGIEDSGFSAITEGGLYLSDPEEYRWYSAENFKQFRIDSRIRLDKHAPELLTLVFLTPDVLSYGAASSAYTTYKALDALSKNRIYLESKSRYEISNARDLQLIEDGSLPVSSRYNAVSLKCLSKQDPRRNAPPRRSLKNSVAWSKGKRVSRALWYSMMTDSYFGWELRGTARASWELAVQYQRSLRNFKERKFTLPSDDVGGRIPSRYALVRKKLHAREIDALIADTYLP